VAAAVAEDGTVEAVEGIRHAFLLGVQWHPERIGRPAAQGGVIRSV